MCESMWVWGTIESRSKKRFQGRAVHVIHESKRELREREVKQNLVDKKWHKEICLVC